MDSNGGRPRNFSSSAASTSALANLQYLVRKEYFDASRQAPYLYQPPTSDDGALAEGGGDSYSETGRDVDSSGKLRRRRNSSLLSTSEHTVSVNQQEADAAAGGSSSFNRRVSSLSNLLPRVASSQALRSLQQSASQSQHQLSTSNHAATSMDADLDAARDRSGSTSRSVFSDDTPRSRIGGTASFREGPQQFVRNVQRYLLDTPQSPDWRLRDRMKTVGVGLVLALNVGTDPPDLTKPRPCAVLECWIDPRSVSRSKAKEIIGERLQQQYSKWQLARASRPLKYRRALDPTVEEVRNLCLQLRRQARSERILLHYNGHGVPRPTVNGEIWVFDKNHTEYIPLAIVDLRQWMGKPSIVVLDCSAAGILIPAFQTPLGGGAAGGGPEMARSPEDVPDYEPDVTGGSATYHPTRNININGMGGGMGVQSGPMQGQNIEFADVGDDNGDTDMNELSSQWVNDTIVLCPCSENEWLPMSPDYPADIFTSCLTTPIPIALRWFVRHHGDSMSGLNPDAVDSIPGKANDRKTPLGELNWIFTAVTDSIAWNSLPKPLFQRLFRQDLLVASMFRNFLLADRILRSLGCTPISFPPLPPGMADHPLWRAWDLACETLLFQLMQDGVLGNHVLIPATIKRKEQDDESDEDESESENEDASAAAQVIAQQQRIAREQQLQLQRSKYNALSAAASSPFFSEQLTAFEVWLEYSEIHKMHLASGMALEPPEQLPVVLQVLLSQVHRIRALRLLRRFLDLGSWAVNLSLSLGIFPYVMKLLQSPEYKSLLVSIWASILAFDPSCRVDLLKDGAFHHFVQHLMWGLNNSTVDVAEAARERTMAGFVLAAVCHEYPAGQAECVRLNLHGNCCALLSSYEQGEKARDATAEMHLPAHFRLWLCMCLANMVKENRSTQNEAYNASVHTRLIARLNDRDPGVRASVCYAFGCLLRAPPLQGSRVSSSQDLVGMQDQRQQQQQAGGPPFASTSSVGLLPQRMSGQGAVIPGAIPVPARAAPNMHSGQLQQPFNPVGPPGVTNLQWRPQHLEPVIGPGVAQISQPIAVAPSHQFLNQPANLQVPHQYVMHAGQQGQANGQAAFLVGSNQVVNNGQASLLAPQLLPQQQVPMEQPRSLRPSVFEDRRRLDMDLSVIDAAVSCAKDASVLVRYEATIALACAVGKYLEAFLVVAEEALASSYEDEMASRIVEIPRGLDRNDLPRFTRVWNALRGLQHDDPFTAISREANNIVSFVHENVLRIRMENDQSAGKDQTDLLPGIHEEASQPPTSAAGIPTTPPLKKTNTRASTAVRPQTKPKLRRVLSDTISWSDTVTSLEKKAVKGLRASGSARDLAELNEVLMNYTLPKSEFYQWKKSAFNTNSQTPIDEEEETSEVDLLSPEGAAKAYQERRTAKVRKKANELRKRFEILAPKPPKPTRRSIEMLLEEEDEEAAELAEGAALKKKSELHLKEKAVLRNDGVNMTSLLRFHPFDDVLVSCSAIGSVALWSTETGARLCKFENGNATGTRMTSGSWINEDSSSLFYIGCDDGTVRIWGDVVDTSGDHGGGQPCLVSAFHALPTTPDRRGSGLICEWQSFSGKMLVGGNSKVIACWDMEAEKRIANIETNTDASVTTLTTAWDADHFRFGTGGAPQAGPGIGPDIVVSGHSDGSLKIFDLRMHGIGNELRDVATPSRNRTRQRVSGYSEHKSWVVATAFTSYANRYELVSGTVAGEIKSWDLRSSGSIRTLDVQRSTITTLSVHPCIPIVATGSHAQFIKVLTLDGDTLQVIRYHEKMSNQRIGPVSCLAFHRNKPMLAAGSTDNVIGLFAPK